MILDIYTKNNAFYLLNIDSNGKTIAEKLNDTTSIEVVINKSLTTFPNIASYNKYYNSEENANNKLNLKSPKDFIIEKYSEYSNLNNINILLVDFKIVDNKLVDIQYFAPNKNSIYSIKDLLNSKNISLTPQNLIKEYFSIVNKISPNIAAIIPSNYNEYWETLYLNKFDKKITQSLNMRNFRTSINKSFTFVEHPNNLILDNTPLMYKREKNFNEYGYLTLKNYETFLEKTKEIFIINYMNKTLDRSTYSNKIWEHTITNLDIKPIDIGKYKPQKKGGFNHAIAGIFHNIQFFDFRSYYPSLFLSLNIENEFTKKLYTKINELLSKRYEIKDILNNTKSEINELKNALLNIEEDNTTMSSSINTIKNKIEQLEKEKELLNSQQLYYKFMINSFIGNLNNVNFKYYYPQLYDAITENGREITKTIIQTLQERYGENTVVYSDTDSIALNLDLIKKSDIDIKNECNEIITHYCESHNLKSGFIELLPEEVYETFVCPGAKNYLGVKNTGEFRINNMGINTSQNHKELIDLLGQYLIDNIDGKNKVSEAILFEKVFELVEKCPEIVFTKNKLNNKTTEEYLAKINQHNEENKDDIINEGDYYYTYKNDNNQVQIFSRNDFINKKFPNLNTDYFAVYNSLLPLITKTLKVLEISNLGAFYKDLGENQNSLKHIFGIEYIEKKDDKKPITTNITQKTIATNQNIKEDKLFNEQKNKFISLINQKLEDFDVSVVNNMSLVECFKLILSNVQPNLILGDGHPLRQDKNRSFSYTKRGEYYIGHDFADGKSYVLFELIPDIRDDLLELLNKFKEHLKKFPNEINKQKLTRSNVTLFLDIIKTFEEKPQYLPQDIKNLTLGLLNKMNIYFERIDIEDFSNNQQETFSKKDVITNYIPINQIPKNNMTTLHKDLFTYLQSKRKIFVLPNELPNIFYVCTQQISNFQPNFFFGLKNDFNGFDGRVFDNHSVASLSKTKIGNNSPTSIVSEHCKKIIIVEGFMDMLSNIQELGYKANIGHISLNGVNQYEMIPYKELLKKGFSIQLSLDKDKAGIVTTINILNKLGVKLPEILTNLIKVTDNNEDLFDVNQISTYIDEIKNVTKQFKQLSIVFSNNNLKDKNEEIVNFYKNNGIIFAKMKYELKTQKGIDLPNIHNFCDLMNFDGLKNKDKFIAIKEYILKHIETYEKDTTLIETTKTLFNNVNNFLQIFLPEKKESIEKFIESKKLDLSFDKIEEIATKYLFTDDTLNQIKSGFVSYSLEEIYKNNNTINQSTNNNDIKIR